MLKLYNIADAMVTGADGTDFTVVGMRLTIMATVDITSVAAGIVDITAYGFRWVRLPPARLLGARLQIGRFDTEGSHVEWCANRYRSYRAYDNTYQPYNGPRRLCNSPY